MKNSTLRIAIEGCCHGELDKIYNAVKARENKDNKKVDLLLICGDFQAMRNISDMHFMSCPDKYKRLGGFYCYYTGEKKAPIPTVFIGGNHEASNYSRELYLGGWAAPNIYFMGHSNVIWFKGLRIGGISGIFNEANYQRGYHERPPFMPIDRFRSLYHTRVYECLKFMQILLPETSNSFEILDNEEHEHPDATLSSGSSFPAKRLDIVLSHEWPSNVATMGNLEHLLKIKPFFKSDIAAGKLGSPDYKRLINYLKPRYWFAAHMHVRYKVDIEWAAVEPTYQPNSSVGVNKTNTVNNDQEISLDDFDDSDCDSGNEPKSQKVVSQEQPEIKMPKPQFETTTFLALDKCLPRREFLEIIDIEVSDPESDYPGSGFKYDPEWIAIQKVLQPLLPKERHVSEHQTQLWSNLSEFSDKIIQTKNELIEAVKDWSIPLNFVKTAPGAIAGTSPNSQPSNVNRFFNFFDNPQTRAYVDKFGIEDIFQIDESGTKANKS